MKSFLQKIALSFVLAVVFASSLLFSACGGYVKTAWVHLKIDDTYKVVYNTADMYSALRHISCYANEEDAISGDDCLLSICFTARSMGGETVQKDDDGKPLPIVNFMLKLKNPVREDIYSYITSSFIAFRIVRAFV